MIGFSISSSYIRAHILPFSYGLLAYTIKCTDNAAHKSLNDQWNNIIIVATDNRNTPIINAGRHTFYNGATVAAQTLLSLCEINGICPINPTRTLYDYFARIWPIPIVLKWISFMIDGVNTHEILDRLFVENALPSGDDLDILLQRVRKYEY